MDGWHTLGALVTAALLAAGAHTVLRLTTERFQGCEFCSARARRYVRTDTSTTATCEDHAGPLARQYAANGVLVLVTPIGRNR